MSAHGKSGREGNGAGSGSGGGGGGGGEKSDRVIVMIAVFKLVKMLFLVAMGVGAFKLMNRDAGELLTRWTSHFHVDPQNRILHEAIAKVSGLDAKKLALLGVGTFVYAAVFAIEGVGLLMKKRWAEYMTVIVTTSFIPLEIWELTKHVSAPKIVTLVMNVAIVIYLVLKLKKQRKEDRKRKGAAKGSRDQRSSSSTHLRPSAGTS